MTRVARIPITNIYADGAYTGRILVGPSAKPMNVLLDSGSAVFALDGRKYQPAVGDRTTKFAQYMSYSDGSFWSGGVIKTTVSVGRAQALIMANAINVALATAQTKDMFGQTDGILGLAYAPLDEAWEMPKDTTANAYSSTRIREGRYTQITPYLRHLDQRGVVADKFGFYTFRSCIHHGAGGVEDPLNKGWMVLGGGEECRDFYTGKFQTAKVLAEQWYNTNLKAIIVGDTTPLAVHQRPPSGYPSNAIVDSGTTSIDLGPLLLKAVVSRFKPDQQRLMQAALARKKHPCVAMADLNLRKWPTLTFILQGLKKTDVTLHVRPEDYWQVNAPKAGLAMLALTQGEPGFAILGLPLMNGYFTIFDGEADDGRGVVKFAPRK